MTKTILHSFSLISSLLMVIAFSNSIALCETPSPKGELTFLNWADYIDPELIEKFEKQYNAKVHQITYDSDDGRTRMLISTDGANFDVAVVDGDSLEAYSQRGWLEPVDSISIPRLELLYPKWRQAYPKAQEFAVPYFWGTTGIAYRTDLVGKPLTKWMQIFKPEESLHGKIFMLSQSRELIDIALKTLGHSVNTTDKKVYEEVKKLLKEQQPYVKKYDVPSVNDTSALVKGTVVAAMTYNGDAMMLNDVDENIIYVTPEEGGVLWVDYLVVFAKGKNKKLAQDFINFLNLPENAAQLAQHVYYASPNMEAEKLLPKDFLEDIKIYPPEDILKRYEIEKKLPPIIQKIRASIFSEVTAGKI